MKSVITRFEILAETEANDGLLPGCMTRLQPITATATLQDLRTSHNPFSSGGDFQTLAQNSGRIIDRRSLGKLIGDPSCSTFQTYHHSNERYADRLLAHAIPRSQLMSISTVTIADCVKWCCDQACRKITELRSTPDPNHQHGRLLGLQLQQFANASLYLRSIGVAAESQSG